MTEFKLKPKSLVGSKRSTQHGFISEARVVKSLGMKPTSASGAKGGDKSDGSDKEFRVECKSTVNKTMALEHEWLMKIQQEALETGKEPLLTISFVFPTGKARKDGDWVLMPKRLFDELTER